MACCLVCKNDARVIRTSLVSEQYIEESGATYFIRTVSVDSVIVEDAIPISEVTELSVVELVKPVVEPTPVSQQMLAHEYWPPKDGRVSSSRPRRRRIGSPVAPSAPVSKEGGLTLEMMSTLSYPLACLRELIEEKALALDHKASMDMASKEQGPRRVSIIFITL